ncbi:phytoene/squalene synthase family protein [Jatrophihabitans sp. DSM 45814]
MTEAVGNGSRATQDSPAEPITIERAYAECDRITREQARNFYWGIRLLPQAKRGALSAVYAAARRVDDIGDGDLPVEQKLAALERARIEITQPAKYLDDPVLVALADAATHRPIPLEAFGELVTGCEQDVKQDNGGYAYQTHEQLLQYCGYVAGSIGRLSLGVFDPPLYGANLTRAREFADALGTALQLTNILRDIREDLLMGRVYLPTEDLELFGCKQLSVLPDQSLDPQDGRLAELIRFEAARAWGWYDRGLQLLPLLDRRSAACCAAMSGIYAELLVRIGRRPEAVMRSRLALSTADKLKVATVSMLGRRNESN